MMTQIINSKSSGPRPDKDQSVSFGGNTYRSRAEQTSRLSHGQSIISKTSNRKLTFSQKADLKRLNDENQRLYSKIIEIDNMP
jgi:hypothetical protein